MVRFRSASTMRRSSSEISSSRLVATLRGGRSRKRRSVLFEIGNWNIRGHLFLLGDQT